MLSKFDFEQFSSILIDLSRLADKISYETIMSNSFNWRLNRFVYIKEEYDRNIVNALICRDIMTCYSSLGYINENHKGYDIIQYIFFNLLYGNIANYDEYIKYINSPAVSQNYQVFYNNTKQLYDCYSGKLLFYSLLFCFSEDLSNKYIKMLRRVFYYLYKKSSKSQTAKKFYYVLRNNPMDLYIYDDKEYFVNMEDYPVKCLCLGNELVTNTDQIEKYLNELEDRINHETNYARSLDDFLSFYDLLDELEKLIGLQTVKDKIHSLISLIKINKMRESNGLKLSPISYHCVFTGNSGTGKRTVANILAGIYCNLDILYSRFLVEANYSDLIGDNIEQTIIKTNQVIDSALDGVLYIKDIYTLTEKQNSIGKKAIAALLKRMYDDKLVVILAGDHDKMNEFINSIPEFGLLFNRLIHFPDYTSEELFELFQLFAKENDYELSPDAANYLKKRFNRIVSSKCYNYKNAEFVLNYFEKAVSNQIHRSTSQFILEYYPTITKEDVEIKLSSILE